MKKVLKATLVLCLVGGAASPSFAQPPPVPLTIDTAAVFAALGRHGTARSNVAQVGLILVSGTVTMGGRPMTPALAYGSPVNVQVVSPTRAVATGDERIEPA